jgi:hypothetical protein
VAASPSEPSGRSPTSAAPTACIWRCVAPSSAKRATPPRRRPSDGAAGSPRSTSRSPAKPRIHASPTRTGPRCARLLMPGAGVYRCAGTLRHRAIFVATLTGRSPAAYHSPRRAPFTGRDVCFRALE